MRPEVFLGLSTSLFLKFLLSIYLLEKITLFSLLILKKPYGIIFKNDIVKLFYIDGNSYNHKNIVIITKFLQIYVSL